MDIQELVESRIRELKGQEQAPPQEADAGELGPDYSPPEGISAEDQRVGRRFSDRQAMPMAGVSDFGEFVDQKLSMLALRMLEISERMSADYGRLEQDLLKSRLEVLRGAEEVLDLILSLRKQCGQFLAHGGRDTGTVKGSAPASGGIEDRGGEDLDRANMHSMGVADLFKRT